MPRLTLTHETRVPPRCPACSERLNPQAIRFVHGIAFCHQCATIGDPGYETLRLQIVDDHARRRNAHEWSASRGLYFWTPHFIGVHATYLYRNLPQTTAAAAHAEALPAL